MGARSRRQDGIPEASVHLGGQKGLSAGGAAVHKMPEIREMERIRFGGVFFGVCFEGGPTKKGPLGSKTAWRQVSPSQSGLPPRMPQTDLSGRKKWEGTQVVRPVWNSDPIHEGPQEPQQGRP